MLVAKTYVSSEIKLQDLSEEIVLKVLDHLPSPVDAISFAKTSRSFHNLIAHEFSYWSHHGATKIPSTLPSLASTWASRARSLSPVLRNVLPRLQEPLDVSSEASVAVLSGEVQLIDSGVEQTQNGENFSIIHGHWNEVLERCGEAGLEPPVFPPKALNLFIEQMPAAIDRFSVTLNQEGADSISIDFGMFSDVAVFAGVKIPLSDETKLLYRAAGQDSIDTAQKQAKEDDTERMILNLQKAAEYARVLNFNLPSLSMAGTSPETQSTYKAFVHALGDDVRPLTLEVATVPSERV